MAVFTEIEFDTATAFVCATTIANLHDRAVPDLAMYILLKNFEDAASADSAAVLARRP